MVHDDRAESHGATTMWSGISNTEDVQRCTTSRDVQRPLLPRAELAEEEAFSNQSPHSPMVLGVAPLTVDAQLESKSNRTGDVLSFNKEI